MPGVDELERDLAIQPGIIGAIHHSHAAFAHLFADLKAAERNAR